MAENSKDIYGSFRLLFKEIQRDVDYEKLGPCET